MVGDKQASPRRRRMAERPEPIAPTRPAVIVIVHMDQRGAQQVFNPADCMLFGKAWRAIGADLVAEYLAPFATAIARRSIADAEVVAACRSGHITDDLRDSDFGVDFPECGNLWRQPQRADGGGGANGHV